MQPRSARITSRAVSKRLIVVPEGGQADAAADTPGVHCQAAARRRQHDLTASRTVPSPPLDPTEQAAAGAAAAAEASKNREAPAALAKAPKRQRTSEEPAELPGQRGPSATTAAGAASSPAANSLGRPSKKQRRLQGPASLQSEPQNRMAPAAAAAAAAAGAMCTPAAAAQVSPAKVQCSPEWHNGLPRQAQHSAGAGPACSSRGRARRVADLHIPSSSLAPSRGTKRWQPGRPVGSSSAGFIPGPKTNPAPMRGTGTSRTFAAATAEPHAMQGRLVKPAAAPDAAERQVVLRSAETAAQHCEAAHLPLPLLASPKCLAPELSASEFDTDSEADPESCADPDTDDPDFDLDEIPPIKRTPRRRAPRKQPVRAHLLRKQEQHKQEQHVALALAAKARPTRRAKTQLAAQPARVATDCPQHNGLLAQQAQQVPDTPQREALEACQPQPDQCEPGSFPHRRRRSSTQVQPAWEYPLSLDLDLDPDLDLDLDLGPDVNCGVEVPPPLDGPRESGTAAASASNPVSLDLGQPDDVGVHWAGASKQGTAANAAAQVVAARGAVSWALEADAGMAAGHLSGPATTVCVLRTPAQQSRQPGQRASSGGQVAVQGRCDGQHATRVVHAALVGQQGGQHACGSAPAASLDQQPAPDVLAPAQAAVLDQQRAGAMNATLNATQRAELPAQAAVLGAALPGAELADRPVRLVVYPSWWSAIQCPAPSSAAITAANCQSRQSSAPVASLLDSVAQPQPARWDADNSPGIPAPPGREGEHAAGASGLPALQSLQLRSNNAGLSGLLPPQRQSTHGGPASGLGPSAEAGQLQKQPEVEQSTQASDMAANLPASQPSPQQQRAEAACHRGSPVPISKPEPPQQQEVEQSMHPCDMASNVPASQPSPQRQRAEAVCLEGSPVPMAEREAPQQQAMEQSMHPCHVASRAWLAEPSSQQQQAEPAAPARDVPTSSAPVWGSQPQLEAVQGGQSASPQQLPAHTDGLCDASAPDCSAPQRQQHGRSASGDGQDGLQEPPQSNQASSVALHEHEGLSQPVHADAEVARRFRRERLQQQRLRQQALAQQPKQRAAKKRTQRGAQPAVGPATAARSMQRAKHAQRQLAMSQPRSPSIASPAGASGVGGCAHGGQQAQRPIAGLEQCFAIPAFVPRDDLLRFRRSFLQVIRLGHYRSRSVPAEAVVRANLYHLFCNHAKVADLEELRMKDVLVALLKHPNKHIKASAKGLLECDPYFSLPRVQPLSMGPPLGQGRTASTAPGIAQPPSPASAALPRVQALSMGPPLGQGRTASTAPRTAPPPSPDCAAGASAGTAAEWPSAGLSSRPAPIPDVPQGTAAGSGASPAAAGQLGTSAGAMPMGPAIGRGDTASRLPVLAAGLESSSAAAGAPAGVAFMALPLGQGHTLCAPWSLPRAAAAAQAVQVVARGLLLPGSVAAAAAPLGAAAAWPVPGLLPISLVGAAATGSAGAVVGGPLEQSAVHIPGPSVKAASGIGCPLERLPVRIPGAARQTATRFTTLSSTDTCAAAQATGPAAAVPSGRAAARAGGQVADVPTCHAAAEADTMQQSTGSMEAAVRLAGSSTSVPEHASPAEAGMPEPDGAQQQRPPQGFLAAAEAMDGGMPMVRTEQPQRLPLAGPPESRAAAGEVDVDEAARRSTWQRPAVQPIAVQHAQQPAPARHAEQQAPAQHSPQQARSSPAEFADRQPIKQLQAPSQAPCAVAESQEVPSRAGRQHLAGVDDCGGGASSGALPELRGSALSSSPGHALPALEDCWPQDDAACQMAHLSISAEHKQGAAFWAALTERSPPAAAAGVMGLHADLDQRLPKRTRADLEQRLPPSTSRAGVLPTPVGAHAGDERSPATTAEAGSGANAGDERPPPTAVVAGSGATTEDRSLTATPWATVLSEGQEWQPTSVAGTTGERQRPPNNRGGSNVTTPWRPPSHMAGLAAAAPGMPPSHMDGVTAATPKECNAGGACASSRQTAAAALGAGHPIAGNRCLPDQDFHGLPRVASLSPLAAAQAPGAAGAKRDLASRLAGAWDYLLANGRQ